MPISDNRFSAGRCQHQRWPDEFADNFLPVEPLNFEQLLTLVEQFSAHINYVDDGGKAAGSWQGLFAHNDIVAIARLRQLDPARLQARFRQLPAEAYQQQWHYLIGLYQQIDQAWQQLKSGSIHGVAPASVPLRRLIESRLASRRTQLESLRVFICDAALASHALPSSFDGLWWKHQQQAARHPELKAQRPSASERHTISHILHGALHSLIFGLKELQPQLKPLLEQSLKSQQHEPAISLFISFLQLYGQLQQRINRFTPQHREFYYRDLLNTAPRPADRRRYWLALQQDPAATQPLQMPAGSVFSAGAEADGTERLYQSTSGSWISQARVSELVTLFLEREHRVYPEMLFNAVTRMRQTRWQGEAGETAPPISLFGAGLNSRGEPVGTDVSPGLMISAPLLAMREGQRALTITFVLAEDDATRDAISMAQTRLNRLFTKGSPLLGRTALSRIQLLHRQLFGDTRPEGREAYRTGAALGWYRVLGRSLRELELQPEAVRGLWLHRNWLLDQLFCSAQAAQFHQLLGELLRRQLFSRLPGWLPARLLPLIRQKACELQLDGAAMAMLEVFQLSRQEQLEGLLNRGFELAVTTADGLRAADHYQLSVLPGSQPGYGFQLTVKLGADFPALIAPDADQAETRLGLSTPPDAPCLQLRLAAGSDMTPWSLLSGFALAQLDLRCEVQGVRALQLWNHQGALSTETFCLPFGSQPEQGAWFMVSGREIAAKPVTRCQLNLQWSGLPVCSGGFDNWYRQYQAFRGDDKRYGNDCFRVHLQGLEGGRWHRFGESQPLFSLVDDQLSCHSQLGIAEPRQGGVLWQGDPAAIDAEAWRLNTDSRAGFLRISLTDQGYDFGQRLYPALLTDSLMKANVALLSGKGLLEKLTDKATKALGTTPAPAAAALTVNPPWTPTLSGLTLDYSATARWAPGDRDDQIRLYHLHPLRMEPLHCRTPGTLPALMPVCPDDGSLYIGLADATPGCQLNLHFELAANARLDLLRRQQPPRWHYLGATGWQALTSQQLIEDGSVGLSRSGVISLLLPDDLSVVAGASGPVSWLRLGCNTQLEGYGTLQALTPHVIDVIAQQADISADAEQWQAQPSVPGLQSVTPLASAPGRREAEGKQQWQSRIREHLSHRGRALLRADYERLVLEAFPAVYRVRCFSCMDDPHIAPGDIWLVVQAQASGELSDYSQPLMLDSLTLAAIHDHLKPRLPATVRLRVINPDWERVQIRCQIVFTDPAQSSFYMEQLRVWLVAQISPWGPQGEHRGFGWSFSLSELEQQISALNYVHSVSGLSLLRRRPMGDGRWRLDDSARDGAATVSAACPWSLPLSLAHHLLLDRSAESSPQAETAERQPQVTTLGQLCIGQTLVIDQDRDHATEKPGDTAGLLQTG